MEEVFSFTEDHGEIMNFVAYNITVTKYMVASDSLM